MSGYRLTKLARDDISQIAEYIARDNPQAALKVVQTIRRTCRDLIANNPLIGQSRDDLIKGCRCFPIGSYVVFFRHANPVEIIRVLHGARDIDRIFEPPAQ